MYTTSNYNEDLHINNEGDSALLECIYEFLDEANKHTKAARRANQARKEFVTSQQQSAIQTAPRPIENKPLPTPSAPTTPVAPKPKNTEMFGPPDSMTKKQRNSYINLQDRIAEGRLIRDEKPAKMDDIKVRRSATYGDTHSGESYPRGRAPIMSEFNKPEPAKPKNDKSAKNEKSGSLKKAAAVVAPLAIAAGKQALSDYRDHGDPLYSAKQLRDRVKTSIDTKKAEIDAEEKRQKDLQEYEEWKKESTRKKEQKRELRKKKALKESCQLYIDEATGTVYYPFVITEGIFKRVRDTLAESKAREPVMRSLQPDFNKACKNGSLNKYLKPMEYDPANEVFELMFNAAQYAGDNKLNLSDKKDHKKVIDLFTSIAKQVEHNGYDLSEAFGRFDTTNPYWWSAFFEPTSEKFEAAKKKIEAKGGA